LQNYVHKDLAMEHHFSHTLQSETKASVPSKTTVKILLGTGLQSQTCTVWNLRQVGQIGRQAAALLPRRGRIHARQF
jgi:hypothetical protein